MCCLIKNLIKLSLFLCNFVIWVAGGVLLGMAIWILVAEPFANTDMDRDDVDFDFSMLDDVIYLLLVVGICLFLLGFLGCCGVMKSSRCMLISYCIMMIIIISLEIAIVSLVASFSSSLGNWMNENAVSVLQTNYTSETADDPVSEAVNYLQTEMHCCGAEDYRDYEDSNFHSNKPSQPVPYTCCEGGNNAGNDFSTCYEEAKDYENPSEGTFKSLYAQGCIALVTDDLDDKTTVLYVVLSLIIFFEVILMVLVFMAQCCCIDKDENEVEPGSEPI